MNALVTTLLSLGVLAAFALIAGGIWTLRRRPAERLRGWLMIVAALVTLANVALWSTMPAPPKASAPDRPA